LVAHLSIHQPTDEDRPEVEGEIPTTPDDMPTTLTPRPVVPLPLHGFEISTNRTGTLGSGMEEGNSAGEAEFG
jgi:hypothetical protein